MSTFRPRSARWPAGVLAALSVALAGCAHRHAGDDRLDRAVEAAIAATPFSGAIVVGRGGRVVLARGFGWADREAHRAFDVDTPADGGSPPRDAGEPDVVAAAALPGRYLGRARGEIELHLQSNRLHLRDRRGVDYRAFRVTRRAFYVPGLDGWLGFSDGEPPQTLHIRSIAGDERARRITRGAAVGGTAAAGELS